MGSIIEAIKAAFRWIVNIVVVIIRGVLDFVANVVNWLKKCVDRLDPNRHIPFIAKKEQFKDMLKNAPVKNAGIFEGVYDEQTDEIVAQRYLEADDLDQRTKDTLGNEPLVVLH